MQNKRQAYTIKQHQCWKWKGKDPSEHKLGKQKKKLCLKSSTKDECSCVNVCEDKNTTTNVQKKNESIDI